MYKERKKIGLYKKKKVGSCDVHTRSNAFDNARDVLIRKCVESLIVRQKKKKDLDDGLMILGSVTFG